jgi:hypothetical protein
MKRNTSLFGSRVYAGMSFCTLRAGTKLFTIRLTKHDSRWQNAIALSWAPEGKEPKHVSLVKGEYTWTFSIAGRKLVFDWDNPYNDSGVLDDAGQ